MKGFLTFIITALVVIALAMLLGTCVIGTFIAPLLWMKITCFVITNIFVVVITLICAALGAMGMSNKE